MLAAMSTGILMAITIFIVMARIGNIRKWMGYPAFLDAGVVLLLALLLHGTFGGMAAAISGGLFFSLMITVIRRYYGYAKFTRRGWVVVSYGALPPNNEGDSLCLTLKSKLLKPWPLCIAGLLILLMLA